MATDIKTLRFRSELRSEIDRIAKRSRRSFSEVTQDLLEEAIRMRKCPGIYFHDEPAGREAKIAGSGLGVWEVISIQQTGSKNAKKLKKHFHWLSDAQLKAALIYYHAWPHEIDDLIDDNRSAAREVPKA
ncbi:MAG: hypothetical protein JRJ87_14575 [Deltaproteobacteria bacterium]|nr:hypothetical protein [Deltaproteobacteria bacterium]